MPSSTKNVSKENNSNLTNTLTHETGIRPTRTISLETQVFLECLESLDNHWMQTKHALRETYSEDISIELMDSTYTPAFHELKKAVQQFLLISIDNNMGLTDSKQI